MSSPEPEAAKQEGSAPQPTKVYSTNKNSQRSRRRNNALKGHRKERQHAKIADSKARWAARRRLAKKEYFTTKTRAQQIEMLLEEDNQLHAKRKAKGIDYWSRMNKYEGDDKREPSPEPTEAEQRKSVERWLKEKMGNAVPQPDDDPDLAVPNPSVSPETIVPPSSEPSSPTSRPDNLMVDNNPMVVDPTPTPALALASAALPAVSVHEALSSSQPAAKLEEEEGMPPPQQRSGPFVRKIDHHGPAQADSNIITAVQHAATNEIAALRDVVQNVIKTQTSHRRAVKTLRTDIDTLRTDNATLRAEIDALKAANLGQAPRVERIEAAFGVVQGQIVSHGEQLRRAEGALGELRQRTAAAEAGGQAHLAVLAMRTALDEVFGGRGA